MAMVKPLAVISVAMMLALPAAGTAAAPPVAPALALALGQVADHFNSTHAVLGSAIDCYRRGDYEQADRLLRQAKAGQAELTLDEVNDLNNYLSLNDKALTARRAGADQLRRAREAAGRGQSAEAHALLNALQANQYLTPADRQQVQQLAAQLRTAPAPTGADRPGGAEARAKLREARALLAAKDYEAASERAHEAARLNVVYSSEEDTPLKVLADVAKARGLGAAHGPAPRADSRALLAAARDALNRGDLDQADRLVIQAENAAAGSRVPTWLHPWSETPARVRRDIQAARARKAAQSATADNRPTTLPPVAPPAAAAQAPARPSAGATPPASPAATTTNQGPPASSGGTQVTSNASPAPTARPAFAAARVDTAPAATADATATARDLLRQGRQALHEGKLDTARQFAERARGLKPDLDWREDNPERLLADVRRVEAARAPARAAVKPEIKQVAVVEPPPRPAAADSKLPDTEDAHELLRQARALFEQGKLDEAEVRGQRASSVAKTRWGLFEDSPEKLRLDIQKVRKRNDQEQAVRVLAEARKLFAEGRLQDAESKAYLAKKLHGPYSILEMGDRPDKLINEIETAKYRNRKTSLPAVPPVVKKDEPAPVKPVVKEHSEGAAKANGPLAGVNAPVKPPQEGPPAAAPAPAVAARAETPDRPARSTTDELALQKARALLVEARNLQFLGRLVEAHQKALEAQKASKDFEPNEDRPEIALVNLGTQCRTRVDNLIQHATDCGGSGDPRQLAQADEDLRQARALTVAFELDTNRVDAKAAWLEGLRASLVARAPLPADPNVVPAAGTVTPDAGEDPRRQEGLALLDKARLELRNGQSGQARQLAYKAFEKQYNVQKEAAAVLRDIDIEDDNQAGLTANRTADAGFSAFNRRDFAHAARIFHEIDTQRLTADRAKRLQEIMLSSEMQPTALAQNADGSKAGTARVSDSGENGPPAAVPDLSSKGKATASDREVVAANEPVRDTLLDRQVGMQEIKFQEMYEKSRAAQRAAMDCFRAGDTDRALEILVEFNHGLDDLTLDPSKVAILRRPVEDRLQRLRTLKAQRDFEREQLTSKRGIFDRQQHNKDVEEQKKKHVAEMMTQYDTLYKEGKYREAEMTAQKTLDLDPDNVAAAAAFKIAQMRERLENYDKMAKNNEQYNLDALNDSQNQGPSVVVNPLKFDEERTKVSKKRKDYSRGMWPETKSAREREIERRLLMPIPGLNFKDTTLEQVINDLADMTGVNVVPDRAALQEAGVGLDRPLTLSVHNVSLKSALNLLLRQVHLTYQIKDEALQITTEENAKGKLKRVTYPVADLVVPVDNHTLPNCNNMNYLMSKSSDVNTPMPGTAPPYTGPYSLPGGNTVGTPSSGAALATAGPGAANGGTSATIRGPGQTIEDLLIKLITSTIEPQSWSDVGGPGTIQYFPLGLALVINQTQDLQEQVFDLLQALRRLQDLEVAIEMRMISVSESFFERIGLDFNINIVNNNHKYDNNLLTTNFQPFGFINKFTPAGFVSGLTPAGTLTPDLGIPLQQNSFALTTPPFGNFPTVPGMDGGLSLGLAFLSDIQVFMFMEAAQGDRRLNVMQAPKLTMFNGQSANLSVNDFQFFITNVQPMFTAYGQPFFIPQNQAIPLGVTLTVQPVISGDRRFVRMNLNPSLTNLANAAVPLIPIEIPIPQVFATGIAPPGQDALFRIFLQQPTFTTINIQTTVSVPDGGTVLLGGLKTLSEGRSEYGPPILSKIPYIDRLFKNVGYGRDVQSLLIMVTPRIIINEEEEVAQTGGPGGIPEQQGP